MKRKRKVAALPRVTLIAYSRRDLLAFTEAAEKLRHAVDDLTAIVSAMPKPRVKKPSGVLPAGSPGEATLVNPLFEV